MSIFLGILLTLTVLLVVVMIHEFGHFITARLTGMKVEEFGIGIPPRAKQICTDKRGTAYTLNWLPLGGFVRISGEDPRDSDSDPRGSFIAKPWLSRVIVLVAGVTMNFFLAFCIFTGLFMYGIAPMTIVPMEGIHSQILPSEKEALKSGFLTHSGIIVNPVSGSIAEKAGVFSGDIILAVNGRVPETPEDVINVIRNNTGFDITLQGAGIRTLHLIPENGKVGMRIAYKNLSFNEDKKIQYSGYTAIEMGTRETVATTRLTFSFLSRMLAGIFSPRSEQEHQEAKNMLSGPIGLGSTFVSVVENSVPVSVILVIIALLSINLGVINILPFPALDGGRIVTTTLYSICSYLPRGKEYFSRIEGILHTAGFLILLISMLYISGLDISRFF